MAISDSKKVAPQAKQDETQMFSKTVRYLLLFMLRLLSWTKTVDLRSTQPTASQHLSLRFLWASKASF